MWVFIFWIALSITIGMWADNKGRSVTGWMLFSLLLSPLLAGIFLAVTSDNMGGIEARAISQGEAKRCPYCAESIKREAVVCRFCGREVLL